MNLPARDRLISYRLTFAERKTTSLFRLVQTNRIAKKSDLDLSQQRNHYEFSFYLLRHFLRIMSFSAMLSEAQNSK